LLNNIEQLISFFRFETSSNIMNSFMRRIDSIKPSEAYLAQFKQSLSRTIKFF